MDGLTLEQANARLSTVETKADLINIFQEISIESRGSIEGAKTVLYSGMDGAKIALLTSDPNIRILDKTDAAKFLDIKLNEDFVYALTKVFEKDNPDFIFEKEIKNRNSALNKFLYSTEEGSAWNTISKRFVTATEGEVVTLIGKKASPNRIFFQTELEALKENPAYLGVRV